MIAACPFPWPRGTPVRIHRVARAVAELGHEVHVVAYHLGKPMTDEPFLTHRTPEVESYQMVDPGPSYRKLLVMDRLLIRTLRQCLGERRFDLIHAHHFEGLLVGVRARSGRLPIVFDAHTTLESELPSYGLGLPTGLKRRLGRLLDRSLPARADFTIAVTDEIRDRLLRAGGVEPDRITVVGNGVEMRPFLAAQQPAGPSAGHETVIYAGSLAAYQRIDLLLRAFRRVREARPSARLVIASEASFAPYEDLAGELGIRDSIDLESGSFERLPGLLLAADVTVNPRVVCDGVSQKNLNYMAAGKPLVTFTGAVEPFDPDESAIAVGPEDWEAFGDAVVSLLESPDRARQMGERARAKVMDKLSWPIRARQIETVYERVLELV
jgi:glycosyltransferase involved in cell wall biosynthesis